MNIGERSINPIRESPRSIALLKKILYITSLILKVPFNNLILCSFEYILNYSRKVPIEQYISRSRDLVSIDGHDNLYFGQLIRWISIFYWIKEIKVNLDVIRAREK